MANRTVQLYKYTKLPTGWRYCKAVFYPNNRIKPHAVLTPDGEQTIKDGYYCLSYNRKWEPVGNDPAEAVRLLMKKRGELLTVANGGSVVREPEGEPKVSGSLYSAFEAWVRERDTPTVDFKVSFPAPVLRGFLSPKTRFSR